MPDYKEMYLTLFRAVEEASRTLIAAEQACEELYMAEGEGLPARPTEAAPGEGE